MSSDKDVRPQKPDELETPGLVWRPRAGGWAAIWQPSLAQSKRDGCPRATKLWPTSSTPANQTEPSLFEWEEIARWCETFAKQALGKNHRPPERYDGTLHTLIDFYQAHEESPFKRLRRDALSSYTRNLKRLDKHCGWAKVAKITAQDILQWQREFAAKGHKAQAMKLISLLRQVMEFGAVMMAEESGCFRVQTMFELMTGKGLLISAKRPRSVSMTFDHAKAFIVAAHQAGRPLMALCQALQFETGMRQRDCIGEWVPIDEPGDAAIAHGRQKWLVGVQWDEIDKDLVLTHRLSKSMKGREAITDEDAGKTEQFDLTLCPLVMAELKRMDIRPLRGPMILDEHSGLPWTNRHFRTVWREIATAAGIPVEVQNRDSRSGAASEADVAGVQDKKIQRTLAHSNEATTRIYMREGLEVRREVQRQRIAKRQGNGG